MTITVLGQSNTIPNLPESSWQMLANRLLQKYILTQLALDPLHWGPHQGAEHSEQSECVQLAVWHKNCFAKDLASRPFRPPESEVRSFWAATVREMEEDIALRRRELAK